VKQKLKMVRGSGNVFRDVGFPPDEAHTLLLRAELMLHVERFVKEQKLTKTAAAKTLRITQPRLNQLIKHKIGLFRLDALVKMLTNAGLHVELRVKKQRSDHQVALGVQLFLPLFLLWRNANVLSQIKSSRALPAVQQRQVRRINRRTAA
jgi:predicted XRE-type DNA-binding protein